MVFTCKDHDQKLYTLKRILINDAEDARLALQEIRFHKQLSGHPAIVDYVSAVTHSPDLTVHGKAEYLLVTEFCSGGSLNNLVKKKSLNPTNILKIFYSVCTAVKHMHHRPNPITHRGIIVENLRLTSEGYVKLCNFESATMEILYPNSSWSPSKRSAVEEQLQKETSMMYRAPETLDTTQNYPIGPSQDIWALGCLLYYLCYGHHPFENSEKLGIIKGEYHLPDNKKEYSVFHHLIMNLLQPNSRIRLIIESVIDEIISMSKDMGVILTDPLYFRCSKSLNNTRGDENSLLQVLEIEQEQPTDPISIKVK